MTMDQILKLLPVIEILGVALAAAWSFGVWRLDRKEQRRLEVTDDCLAAYSQLVGLVQDRLDVDARRRVFLASLTLDMKAHLLSPDLAGIYRDTFRRIDATPEGQDVDPHILDGLRKAMTGTVRRRAASSGQGSRIERSGGS